MDRRKVLCRLGALSRILLLLSLGLISAPSIGWAQVYFRMDCSRPFCNFPQNWNAQEGVLYNTSVVVGGCPDGTNSFRIAYRPGPYAPGIVQHYLGFALQGVGTTVSQGMSLYIRWRSRLVNGFPGGANNLGWAGKFIMVGDGAGNEDISRVIINQRDNGMTAESSAFDLSRNIDGAVHGTGVIPVPTGQWVAGQAYIKSSSTVSANDGQLKLWLNAANAALNTPSASSPQFPLSVVSWAGGTTKFGGFMSLEQNPVWNPAPIVEICGFEVGAQFVPNWHLTSGPPADTTAPAPPTNLHN